MKNVIALPTVAQKNEKSKAKLRWNRIIVASVLALVVLGFSIFGVIQGLKNVANHFQTKQQAEMQQMFDQEVQSGNWNQDVAIEEVSSTYLGLDIDTTNEPEKFELKKSDYEGHGYIVYLNEVHPKFGTMSVKVWLYYNSDVEKFIPQFEGL